MKENFNDLRNEFEKIKKMGLIKPLRKGSTGIGYTFETLLNKKEDAESIPDYKGIEIKTKLGYSKSHITLFHCVPIRKNENAIKYIFKTYSYNKNDDYNTFLFSRNIYSNKSIKKCNCEFKLVVDYYQNIIILKSYFNGFFFEDVCYWNFSDLEKKLKVKLSYLAIIYAYPYTKNKVLYYKYLKMNTYKLKGFFEFLKLIENDKIYISIYLKKINNSDIIDNHGIAFKIHFDSIEDLFNKIYY